MAKGGRKKRTKSSSTWRRVRTMLGYGVECKNNGRRDIKEGCICEDFFAGDACERVLCQNNGTAIEGRGRKAHCDCPHPNYVKGRFCQQLECSNGGRDTGKGQCVCLEPWYHGQFCEHYSSPWVYLLAGPLVVIVLLCVACYLCRSCCSNKASSRRRVSRSPNSTSEQTTNSPDSAQREDTWQANPRLLTLRRHDDHEMERGPPRVPVNLEELAKEPTSPPSYTDVIKNLDRYPASRPVSIHFHSSTPADQQHHS